MSCSEYGPLVSRYLDDELETRELEAFIDHLSHCDACQQEIESFEQLRGWLQAADALHGFPEPNMDGCVRRILEQSSFVEAASPAVQIGEVSAHQIDEVAPRRAGRQERGRQGFGAALRDWLNRIFPHYPSVSGTWRLALPLLVLGLVGLWAYQEKTASWIDVKEISSAQVGSEAMPIREGTEEHLYVIEHTMHNPWVSYGDELPHIELATGAYR